MSSPDFGVSEEKQRWLETQMALFDVKEADLEESFVRSSGSGGQHVNKTSTRVQIKHLPTGITVSSQKERSQALNRFFARRALLERLAKLAGLPTKADTKAAKIKKQKSRRARKSAKKNLTESL